jgi:glutathione synthase/RimK-type ligase-like ATP-grasp enzyme
MLARRLSVISGRLFMNKVVSLITYSGLAQLDPDDRYLQKALESRNVTVKAQVWDDDSVDWTAAGTCVVRSTWDYHKKFDKFCRWLQYLGTVAKVFNDPVLMQWNARKTYLKELSEAGLPVIPTKFVSKQFRPRISATLRETGWKEAVLKPTVGLATSGVKKIDQSRASLDASEFLPSVHYYGERALIFIDGQYSHCVRKSAFQALTVAGEAGETAVLASEEEINVAASIIAHLSSVPLYARVDLVRDNEDKPLLLELELIEPSLFLGTKPEAADAMAEALIRRM